MRRLSAALLFALTACDPKPSGQGRPHAAVAEFDAFKMVVPAAPRSSWLVDASSVRGGAGESLALELCDLRPTSRDWHSCEHRDLALAGRRGFFTLMIYEQPVWRLLKERPVGPPTPAKAPLRKLKEGEVAVVALNEREAQALGRLGISDGSVIKTTDAGWPLVSCSRADPPNCSLGFLIDDVFVVTSWSNRGGEPSQAEAWRIGTQLDAKLRSFISR